MQCLRAGDDLGLARARAHERDCPPDLLGDLTDVLYRKRSEFRRSISAKRQRLPDARRECGELNQHRADRPHPMRSARRERRVNRIEQRCVRLPPEPPTCSCAGWPPSGENRRLAPRTHDWIRMRRDTLRSSPEDLRPARSFAQLFSFFEASAPLHSRHVRGSRIAVTSCALRRASLASVSSPLCHGCVRAARDRKGHAGVFVGRKHYRP